MSMSTLPLTSTFIAPFPFFALLTQLDCFFAKLHPNIHLIWIIFARDNTVADLLGKDLVYLCLGWIVNIGEKVVIVLALDSVADVG